MNIKQHVRIKVRKMNVDVDSKRYKNRIFYLPKRIIDNYNVIISEKTFMINQLILI